MTHSIRHRDGACGGSSVVVWNKPGPDLGLDLGPVRFLAVTLNNLLIFCESLFPNV